MKRALFGGPALIVGLLLLGAPVTEAYAFVINRHAAEKWLSLIETDNQGGGAKIFLTGDARRR
jgi:hypothetical protein